MGGLGLLITAAIAVLVGLTKLAIKSEPFINAFDSLRVCVRHFAAASWVPKVTSGTWTSSRRGGHSAPC
jgi:hypothetical protein